MRWEAEVKSEEGVRAALEVSLQRSLKWGIHIHIDSIIHEGVKFANPNK